MLGRRFSSAELVRSYSKTSNLQAVKGSLEKHHISPAAYGYALVGFGVLLMIPHSLFFRLSSRNTPEGTVLFYYFLLWGVVSSLFVVWLERKNLGSFFDHWRWKVVATLLQAASVITFTGSLQETSAANTLVFFSTQPLFAAILSTIILKEPLRLHTAVACVLCFGAIVFIFVGELGESAEKIHGNSLALGSALCVAFYSILVRHVCAIHKDVNMVICPGLGKLLAVPYALAVKPSNLMDVDTRDLPWMVVVSSLTTPLAFIMFTIGPKYIPAAEVGLLWLIEAVLGPLLVYIGGFEKPSERSFVGGAVIVLTLLVHGVYTIRKRDSNTATSRSKVQMERVSSFQSDSVLGENSFRSRVDTNSNQDDNNKVDNGASKLEDASASRSEGDSSALSEGNSFEEVTSVMPVEVV